MKSQEKIDVPAFLLCPLTQKIMKEPVMTVDGITYERSAIEEWFSAGNKTKPNSRLILESQNLIPNLLVKQIIEDYKEKQSQEKSSKYSDQRKAFQTISMKNSGIFEANEPNQYSLGNDVLKFEKQWRVFQEKYKIWLKELNKNIDKCKAEVQFSNGRYRGQMNNSVRQGDGYMRYQNGERFWGQWKNDKKEGFGQLKKNQLIYFGQWKKGQLCGFGWICPEFDHNLMIYKGEWQNDKKTGIGIEFNPDVGETYYGEWRENKKHGRGWTLDINGKKEERVWVNDEINDEPIMNREDKRTSIIEKEQMIQNKPVQKNEQVKKNEQMMKKSIIEEGKITTRGEDFEDKSFIEQKNIEGRQKEHDKKKSNLMSQFQAKNPYRETQILTPAHRPNEQNVEKSSSSDERKNPEKNSEKSLKKGPNGQHHQTPDKEEVKQYKAERCCAIF